MTRFGTERCKKGNQGCCEEEEEGEAHYDVSLLLCIYIGIYFE